MRTNQSLDRASVKLRGVVAAVVFASASAASETVAQGTATTFTPGSREIYALDLSSTAGSEAPKSLHTLTGKLSVVTKDGVRMLKAAEPSEFLINLPEALPTDFTLEFEITPKACCNPADLMFEGTATMSRSATSAQVSWHPQTLIVVGGGEYFQTPMPSELADVLPSAPAQVSASFQNGGLTLFTNGRQVLSLPNRAFAHGRVLRVFLGGQDDDQHAVYLSKLRIAAGGGTMAVVASNQGTTGSSGSTTSGFPSSPAVTRDSVATATTTTSAATAAGATSGSGSTSSAGSASTATGAGPQQTSAVLGTGPINAPGATVMWSPVTNATSYRIFRMATMTQPGVLAGTVTAADAAKAQSIVGSLAAVDLDGGAAYWVEAVFTDGSRSEPGPVAETRSVTSQVSLGPSPVPNLRATVGGTTTVTLLDGQQVRGSKVTWNWDQFPTGKAYFFWATVETWQAASATIMPSPQLYHTEKFRIVDTAPMAILNDGGTAGPPYSLSFASGTGVRFCVAAQPISQLALAGTLLTAGVSCVSSQLPP